MLATMDSQTTGQRQESMTNPRTLIFTLRIPGRMPSLNQLIGRASWTAHLKLKKTAQREFISALSLSVNASAIPIIASRSGISTLSGIVARLQAMSRTNSRLKSSSEKPPRAKKSTP